MARFAKRQQKTKNFKLSSLFATSNLDWTLIIQVLILCVIGIFMVYSGSHYIAANRIDRIFSVENPYTYLYMQVVWVLLGIFVAFILFRIKIGNLKKMSIIFYLIVLGLLVITLILPNEINGAKRWLIIGPFTLQASEFAKPALILALSQFVPKTKFKTYKEYFWKLIFPFIFLTFLYTILVLLGKDLDSAGIIAIIGITMLFFAENSNRHLITLIFTGIFGAIAAFFAVIIEPFRITRLTTYIEFLLYGEISNPLGTGYQLNQILIAVGSGGFFGLGYGQSKQKYFYLQETAFTDTIFAIIAEEMGTFISVIFLFLLILFFSRISKYIKLTDSFPNKLIIIGILVWFFVQTTIHLGANLGLLPLAGVALPFVSYGGSSMLSCFIGIGILISMNNIKK